MFWRCQLLTALLSRFFPSTAGFSGAAGCLRRCRLGFLSSTAEFTGAASCLSRGRLGEYVDVGHVAAGYSRV